MSGLIYEAIPAILADVDAIGKNKKNEQQGYKFRGIDDVYNAIHPLLAKHKVFPTCEILSREVTERTTQRGGVLFYVNLKAKYTLFACDGSSIVTEACGEAMDSGDKATNKAMSAAYKYALFQLLCIPTEAIDSETETHQDIAPAKPLPEKADKLSKDDTGAFDYEGYFREKLAKADSHERKDILRDWLIKNREVLDFPKLLAVWYMASIDDTKPDEQERVKQLNKWLGGEDVERLSNKVRAELGVRMDKMCRAA